MELLLRPCLVLFCAFVQGLGSRGKDNVADVLKLFTTMEPYSTVRFTRHKANGFGACRRFRYRIVLWH